MPARSRQADLANFWSGLATKDQIFLGGAAGLLVMAAVLNMMHSNAVVLFIASGGALALLAAVVGLSTEQLGARLGPGATGVLQSALGNLPELFVGIFALRAGLIDIVESALVGSILGNSLLVLGLAFLVGGLKHGTQRFAPEVPRTITTLTLLVVAALLIPTLVSLVHSPAAPHIEGLSVAIAVILLIVFAGSIPVALKGGPIAVPDEPEEIKATAWPMGITIGLLVAASISAAFVSEWFVGTLTVATAALHLSPAFTGLVIVALAGNAVEHAVGVSFAARNQQDFAVSVILNSSLQVALGLIPVLVLLSFVIGGAHLTLVLPPLLLASLALTAILGAFIVFDGESTWLEGLALIGLYCIIAAAFWWG